MDAEQKPYIAKTSQWTAWFILLLFLSWLFCFGGLIANTALNDSDSCWLLALGRWIVGHLSLPITDPFSSGISTYATIIPGAPLAQYQWLAESLFFIIYQIAKLPGLLVLVSCVAYITFIFLPYTLLSKINCPKALSFLLIFISSAMAYSRLFVRPHTFSLLFLAVLIYLYIPSKTALSKISPFKTLAIIMIMLLWTNTHIFFPLGIIFLSLVILSRFLESRFIDRDNNFDLYQFLLPVIAFLPTLINPWGKHIWAYVERLSQCPVNQLAPEMVPVNLLDWHNADTIYLLLFLAIYFLLVRHYRAFSRQKIGLVSPMLAISALYLSLDHSRLIPVSSLFMLAACAELIARQPINSQQKSNAMLASNENFWPRVNACLQSNLAKSHLWLPVFAATMLIGTTLTAIYKPPTLPNASSSFQPPFAAITFLKAHWPQGKVFNDALYGSMMTWYLPDPDIFYDSRFSQYEPERMVEYLQIATCGPDFEKIWQKYKFNWAFIPASIPLSRTLQQMGWTTIYKDKLSIILVE